MYISLGVVAQIKSFEDDIETAARMNASAATVFWQIYCTF